MIVTSLGFVGRLSEKSLSIEKLARTSGVGIRRHRKRRHYEIETLKNDVLGTLFEKTLRSFLCPIDSDSDHVPSFDFLTWICIKYRILSFCF